MGRRHRAHRNVPLALAAELSCLAEYYRALALDSDRRLRHASVNVRDRGFELELDFDPMVRDLVVQRVAHLSREVVGLHIDVGDSRYTADLVALDVVHVRVSVTDLDPALLRHFTNGGDRPTAAGFLNEVGSSLDSLTVALGAPCRDAQVGQNQDSRAEERLLGCLAGFLPASGRSRFVAEALGNLGACDHWWQRADHLVCLALGTPRLAWMMRREGSRGRV